MIVCYKLANMKVNMTDYIVTLWSCSRHFVPLQIFVFFKIRISLCRGNLLTDNVLTGMSSTVRVDYSKTFETFLVRARIPEHLPSKARMRSTCGLMRTVTDTRLHST